MQKKIRDFEIAKGWENKGINLPKRQTRGAAGYDIEAAEDVTIPSIWWIVLRWAINKINRAIFNGFGFGVTYTYIPEEDDSEEKFKPTLVPTGVKAYMQDDEVLLVVNRSSNPLKRGLVLANSLGIIDSDYYSNPQNDGVIMFGFWNFFPFPIKIKKGERIGQGIFIKFLKTDSDVPGGERVGGHGSTGIK